MARDNVIKSSVRGALDEWIRNLKAIEDLYEEKLEMLRGDSFRAPSISLRRTGMNCVGFVVGFVVFMVNGDFNRLRTAPTCGNQFP